MVLRWGKLPQRRCALRSLKHARVSRAGRRSLGLLFVAPDLRLADALATARAELPAVDFVACTTAGELTERGLTRGGVSLILVNWGQATHRVAFVREPGSDPAALAQALCAGAYAEPPPVVGLAACVVLGDGLSPMFEKLVQEIRRTPRHDHPVVGGGAGDDGRYESTSVGVNEQVASGGSAAIQVSSRIEWGVGVAHGLRPVSSRMTVTRATGNVVSEIDGRPALEVYREYARERGAPIDEAHLNQFLVENELGVLFFEDVVRVRAPIRVLPDESLFFAGEVPEGSSVCIVRGEHDQIVAAARSAAEEARQGLGGARAAGLLVFSCVCRGMVLGARYADEVTAIREVFPDTPLAGFSSYGEVARTRNKLDGYHNNTIVIAAIPE